MYKLSPLRNTHSPRHCFPNNLAILISFLLTATSASPIPISPSKHLQWERSGLPSLSIPNVLLSATSLFKLLYLTLFISISISVYLVYNILHMRRSARLLKRKEDLGFKEKQKEKEALVSEDSEWRGYITEEKIPRIVVDLPKEERQDEKEKEGYGVDDGGDVVESKNLIRKATASIPPTSWRIEKRKCGRRRLQRMKSSPSFSINSGLLDGNLSSISLLPSPITKLPSSTSTPPPSSRDQTTSKETHKFGENPDYTSHISPSEHATAYPSPTSSSLPSHIFKFSKLIPTERRRISNQPSASQLPTDNTTSMAMERVEDQFMISTAHFPLPTLRPEGNLNNSSPFTPFISMPSSPTIIALPDETNNNHESAFPHANRLQGGRSGHIRTRSLPVATESVLFSMRGDHVQGNDGNGIVGNVNGEMVIVEQGQSMDGGTGERWKWRRKVRIFRSDALRRLEREGLVRF